MNKEYWDKRNQQVIKEKEHFELQRKALENQANPKRDWVFGITMALLGAIFGGLATWLSGCL